MQTRPTFTRPDLIDFEYVAAFDQHHTAHGTVHGSGQFRVQLELAVFAVNGDEIPRPYQVDNQPQFFLAGVAAYVDRGGRAVVIYDMSLAAEEVVDQAIDGLLVAGNDARGEHDRVMLFDSGVLVIIDRGAGECGHRLALGAADENTDFLRRKILHLAGMNQQAFGNVEVAQILGDFGRAVHRAANERHFPSVLKGQIDGQPDAVNRRREARDEQAALRAGEDFVELAANGALAGCVAFALDVGGILQQREYAFLAVLRESVQIEEAVIGRRGVHLEVAGVDDHAQGRMDGQGHTIHQAVRYLDGVDTERADLDANAGFQFIQFSIVEQAMLIELVFDIGQREFRTPYWYIQFGEDPWDAADVIFMPVGEDDGANFVPVLGEVADVGDDDVHAQQFGLGKHEAGVDDNDIVAPADGHAVHTELAQAAQGDDVKFFAWHWDN